MKVLGRIDVLAHFKFRGLLWMSLLGKYWMCGLISLGRLF